MLLQQAVGAARPRVSLPTKRTSPPDPLPNVVLPPPLDCDVALDFPPSSLAAVKSGCTVFPGVISSATEELLWGELQRILHHGHKTVIPTTGETKNIQLTLFGFDDYCAWDGRPIDASSVPSKAETPPAGTSSPPQQTKGNYETVLGIVWSPTLLEFCRGPAAAALGAVPDTVRVVEHSMPGDDFFMLEPPLGRVGLMLNLLAPTLVDFDNETQAAVGSVLVPNRALLQISGGLRWGWRVGQRSEAFEYRKFRGRSAQKTLGEDCYRLAVWLFKRDAGLVDARGLIDMADGAVAKVLDAQSIESKGTADTQSEGAELPQTFESPGAHTSTSRTQQEPVFRGGLLGGDEDFVRSSAPKDASNEQSKVDPQDLAKKYETAQQDFGSLTRILQEAQLRKKNGEHVGEEWISQKMTTQMSHTGFQAGADAAFVPPPPGTDPLSMHHVNAQWTAMNETAQKLRSRFQSMDYNGKPKQAGVHSTNDDNIVTDHTTTTETGKLLAESSELLSRGGDKGAVLHKIASAAQNMQNLLRPKGK